LRRTKSAFEFAAEASLNGPFKVGDIEGPVMLPALYTCAVKKRATGTQPAMKSQPRMRAHREGGPSSSLRPNKKARVRGLREKPAYFEEEVLARGVDLSLLLVPADPARTLLLGSVLVELAEDVEGWALEE